MGADALAHVLRPLAATFGAPPDALLVGLGMADDAAVYQINDQQAIVATTDFFPPVVDDPYTFGAVAAANALSDIYAMGGTPLFCLNLVAFPDDLDSEILSEILRGGAEKVREAGAVVAGGHTVTDDEPKYGLAAIGLAHPQRIFRKGGAQPGDTLLLTKPLGTGVVTTALKGEAVREDDLRAAVASMSTLNAAASAALRDAGGEDVHACTDITGFGLLGHAWEVAEQSRQALHLTLAQIPWLPGAREYAANGYVPGGTERNATHLAGHVTFAADVGETDKRLLFDPQTSGGLFAAIAPRAVERVTAALMAAGVPAYNVGSVRDGAGIVVA